MLKSIQTRLRLARRQKGQIANEHRLHEIHCTALCCASNGQRAIVKGFLGDEREVCRLRDLGVREGTLVTVLRDGDPLVIRIDDARFGISRSTAMNVMCDLL